MRFNRVRFLHGIAIAASAIMMTVPALAADSEPTPETEGSQDIIVTALKRGQNLQDVPASISAISGDALSEQGVANVRDLSKLVPNLVWGEHFGTTFVNIRGVGAAVTSGANEPTVALYLDGIALPRSDMATLRAVDLDRVEVLRGPQGTLYGRNATGGAINFITPAPSRTWTGKVELSAGGRDAWGVNGHVSGPLADGIYVRLSGGREKADGYVTVVNTGQKVVGTDATYARLAARLEPTSALSIDLSVRYDNEDAPQGNQQLLTNSPIATPDQQTTEPYKIIANYPFSGRNWTVVATAGLNWDISDRLALKSLSGYVRHNSHVGMDDDATSADFYHTDDFSRPSKSVSQEFTLSGEGDKLDWLVGAYYFHEDYEAYLPVILGSLNGPASGLEIGLGQRAKINNAALYTDLTYSLSDIFKINVGARYNHEDSKYAEVLTLVPGGETGIPYAVKKDKFLPKLALRVEPSENVSAYLQWSRGYKSGGVNLPASSGDFFGLYGPEQLDAFEIGLKTQTADRRLTANLAAYYYEYKGMQIDRGYEIVGVVVENANATNYGIEAEIRWSPVPDLTFNIAPVVQHARFESFSSFDSVQGVTRDFKGKRIPRAPDFSVNAGVQFGADLGGTLLSRLEMQGNLVHTSKNILSYFDNAESDRQPALTLVNISATLINSNGNTRLTAFVNNLTNETYKQLGAALAAGPGSFFYAGNYGPPRTWGVRLSQRF